MARVGALLMRGLGRIVWTGRLGMVVWAGAHGSGGYTGVSPWAGGRVEMCLGFGDWAEALALPGLGIGVMAAGL